MGRSKEGRDCSASRLLARRLGRALGACSLPPLGEEHGAWLSGREIGEDFEPISPHIHVTEADRARQRAGWLAETLVPMQREGTNASAPLEPHPIYGKREPKKLWAPPPSPPPERDEDGLGERGFNPTVGKVPLVLNGP